VAEDLTRRPRIKPLARRENRRARLIEDLEKAGNGRDVLAAATRYFRSSFARADDATIERMARAVIDLTDREVGVNRDGAAH
jgi:hypothetical protein